MLQTNEIWIGARRVISSGSITIAGGEQNCTIKIRELSFIVSFQMTYMPPSADYIVLDDNNSQFRFSGYFTSSGVTWHWDNVATFDGGILSASFDISCYSGDPNRPPTWSIIYTFGLSANNYPGIASQ